MGPTPKFQAVSIDQYGNEIGLKGKRIAGFFLVFFTLMSVFIIIAYWPDRIPNPDENIQPYYNLKCFHVRLVTSIPSVSRQNKRVDSLIEANNALINKQNEKISEKLKTDKFTDTPNTLKEDDHKDVKKEESPKDGNDKTNIDLDKLVHLNTLLLFLVAAGGFLGNMIHIATSFTVFVASGQFKRSWALWYCVKPFTATALAIVMYFVLCTGLLNVNNGSNNVNIYGIMTISILVGLFTDRTTIKLKEVFEVLLKPKDERSDKLVGDLKITNVNPETIKKGTVNAINLIGENLQNTKFTISINDEIIPVILYSATTAVINYTIPETQKDKTEFILIAKNEKNESIGNPFTLKLTEDNSGGNTPGDSQVAADNNGTSAPQSDESNSAQHDR